MQDIDEMAVRAAFRRVVCTDEPPVGALVGEALRAGLKLRRRAGQAIGRPDRRRRPGPPRARAAAAQLSLGTVGRGCPDPGRPARAGHRQIGRQPLAGRAARPALD
jgi:hypothetical protein